MENVLWLIFGLAVLVGVGLGMRNRVRRNTAYELMALQGMIQSAMDEVEVAQDANNGVLEAEARYRYYRLETRQKHLQKKLKLLRWPQR